MNDSNFTFNYLILLLLIRQDHYTEGGLEECTGKGKVVSENTLWLMLLADFSDKSQVLIFSQMPQWEIIEMRSFMDLAQWSPVKPG